MYQNLQYVHTPWFNNQTPIVFYNSSSISYIYIFVSLL